MAKHFVSVKDLPAIVRTALDSVGYGRKDIAVEAKAAYSFAGAYGDGFRAYAIMINTLTGESRQIDGSWSGESINGGSPIDRFNGPMDLPLGGIFISGNIGGGHPVSASLTVRPEMMPGLLPAVEGVSERDRKILAIFGSLKSFARPEELTRMGATAEEIAALVSKGFLSRNKAGATSITTSGKNARGNAQAW